MTVIKEPVITRRESVDVGGTEITINEFNDGERFMLVFTNLGSQFHAHLSREDWAAFRGLAVQMDPDGR